MNFDDLEEDKPNQPGNLAYQGAKMLLGDKPSDPEFSPKGGGIQEIASPVDFIPYEELGSTAMKGAKSIGQTIAELGPKYLADETGALQLAVSNGQLTKEGQKISNLSEDNPVNKIKARFGTKKMDKYIDKIQSPKNAPYVYDEKKSPIPLANYSSEPTGVIGNPGISEPHGKNLDPLAWYDMKHGATKKLIEEHKVKNIPLTINTSSDLVGHSDYIEKMPQNTVVNMHLIPEDPKISSGAFGPMRELLPGNPSRSRQLKAIDALRESGIHVNVIEPKSEDLIKYFGPEKISEKTGMSPEDFKSKVFPRERFQLIKNYADGGMITSDFDSLKEDGAVQADRSPASAPISFDSLKSDEDVYGTIPQQALTAVEGLSEGFSGPVATLAEKGLTKLGVPGLSPEEQKLRKETNPITHGATEALGLGVGALTGTGEIGLLGKAAEAVNAVNKLGVAGKGALRGAIEMAGLGAGDEISRAINQDPDQTAQTALAHIGLDAALGAGGGALFGAISEKWFGEHGSAVDQHLQDFKNDLDGTIDRSARVDKSMLSNLSKLKPEAKEIINIGEKHDWPVLEGMVSGSKEIQMAEDALVNGPPTIASIARRKAYQDAYNAVTGSLDQATSASKSISETEVGNQIKESLLGKLNTWYEPIKTLYSEIEPYRQAIPITDRSTGALTRTIEKIIKEQGLVPGSERYNFVRTFADGISNVDNLQSLKNFRTEVSRSAGPLTKDLAGAISDKLDGVEERSIKRFSETMKTGEAKDRITNLLDLSNSAKSQYAAYRETLQELGNSLGKKKIYGPQNFMDFLEDLNPQALSKRAFNGNNTEFASYLSKKFPEEMGIIRDYQRGLLRSEAMQNGELSVNKLIKKIENLEPEMKKLLFSKEEIGTIEDATRYLNSMPKKFNPSGTAHESAFREFFEHPTGAVIANLRDYGIQSFIKAFGRSVPGAEKSAAELIPFLGPKIADMENNPKAFKAAIEVAMSSMRGAKAISKGATNILAGEFTGLDDTEKAYALDKKLKKLELDQSELANTSGEVGHYLPDHATSISSSLMNAVNYLNAQRPKEIKANPLDDAIKPGKIEERAFMRKLEIAQNPLMVYKHIKNGTLIPQDVNTLKAIYPSIYKKMSDEIVRAMNDRLTKKEKIPYSLRQPIGMFLGQPIDSINTSMMSQAIMMSSMNKSVAQTQGLGHGRQTSYSMKAQDKVNSLYETPLQSRASHRNR